MKSKNLRSEILKEAAMEEGLKLIELEIRQPESSIIRGLPRICEHLDGEECLSESPCDDCRFESEREAKCLMYRINIRPLWKNNAPRVYWPLCHDIAKILLDETGKAPWYEPTTKGFKFELRSDKISMKTVIALQAIGYNNGGYLLSIERIL